MLYSDCGACALYASTECALYTDDTSTEYTPTGRRRVPTLLFWREFPDINICSTASLVTHSTGARGEASMKGEHSGGHWRTRLTLIVLISTLLQRNNLTSAGEFGQG